MLGRWWIYLNEMFKPVSRLLFSVLLTSSIAIWVLRIEGRFGRGAGLNLNWHLVARGAATIFMFLIFYRSFDELKDVEVDRKYFPERPLPSGRVYESDLKILMWSAFGLMIMFNFWDRGTLLTFALLLVYGVFMRYNFFAARYMAKNRILAFATHSPVGLVANFYLISLLRFDPGVSLLSKPFAVTALWFFIPGALHEVARKTLPPSQEREGYQTYSEMLGYRGSTILVIALALAHAVLLPVARNIGAAAPMVTYAYLGGLAVLLMTCAAFFITPEKVRNRLTLGAELFAFIVLLIPTLEWFV